jgi:C-terminal processing protease CtpA/Prc
VQVDDNENLVIARILEGGMIEKQGLLHVGDVILEVNGTPVNSAEELQTEVAKSKDSVTLKVGQPKDPETHASLVMNGTNNGVSKKLTVRFNPIYTSSSTQRFYCRLELVSKLRQNCQFSVL